jgi:multiple sugar transport system substrate-binding protein
VSIFRRKWQTVASAALAAAIAVPALAPAHIQAQSASAPKVKLVFWHHNDASWIKAYKSLTTAYEKLHPNVTISEQTYSFSDLPTKLQTVAGTSSAPDVVGIFGTNVTTFARSGKFDAVPSSIYTTRQMQDTYYAAATGAGLYNGKYYSIPHEYNVENDGMLVSPQAFKGAGITHYPTTWAELRADAAKLTTRSSGRVKRAGFLFVTLGSTPSFFMGLILQQPGGYYFSPDKVHVNFNTPQAAKALQEMANLQQYGSLRDFPINVLDVSDYFFRGQAAIAFRGSWTIAVGQTLYPKVKFDYVTMPSFTRGVPPYFAAESGWSDAVTANSPHKDVAWDFVKFMNSKDNARYWNITTSTIPARKDLTDDAAFLKVNPLLKPTLGILKYGRWVGPVQDRYTFFNSSTRYIEKVFNHSMGIPDALKAMTSEINAAIDKQLGNGQ